MQVWGNKIRDSYLKTNLQNCRNDNYVKTGMLQHDWYLKKKTYLALSKLFFISAFQNVDIPNYIKCLYNNSAVILLKMQHTLVRAR